MIDVRALNRAVTVGTLLQVTLAVLSHYSPWIYDNAYLFMGMMVSATASFLYARDVGPGHARGLLVGAVIGGACALVGLAVSVGLGDTTLHDFWLRTVISIVTGAVGGPFGQMSFRLRQMGY
ncbi:MAG TPA: hypothetical protein VMH86_01210 [Rhizomicrobium sp.]|nr:hypothetical protein [Rhizomicrobium sp.]